MEHHEYEYLLNYLLQQPSPAIDTKTKKRLELKSRFFAVQNNILFKKDRRKQTRNKLLKVLRPHEVEPVIFMMHNHPLGGHLGIDTVFEKIRNLYYWPQMYNHIKSYIKTCDACQRRGKQRNTQPLQPIPVRDPFYQIGIDIVGPLPITPRNKRYIVVATDYMTKWPEARALDVATAEKVAEFIFEEIICRHGCPHIILSDRGTHFRNQMIANLLERFRIKHLFSTPYHPQTNGLVERFNRTLCESLARTTEIVTNWDINIPAVLFAYRTAKQATTKIEPFYLVYGRPAKMPITEGVEIAEENLLTRLFHLVDELPENREKVKRQIKLEQQKQKDYHDRKIKVIIQYEIGDKVLMYLAIKDKNYSGKLEPNWKGPYYIHDKLKPDVYKLRTLDGKVLRTPINGSLLKKYNERNSWVPQITIT